MRPKVEFRYRCSKASLMHMTSLCHSITKLSLGTRYSACPLLRLRCKHMFLQMHSINDPNLSLGLVPNTGCLTLIQSKIIPNCC